MALVVWMSLWCANAAQATQLATAHHKLNATTGCVVTRGVLGAIMAVPLLGMPPKLCKSSHFRSSSDAEPHSDMSGITKILLDAANHPMAKGMLSLIRCAMRNVRGFYCHLQQQHSTYRHGEFLMYSLEIALRKPLLQRVQLRWR